MVGARKTEHEEWVSPLAEQWPYLRFLGLGAWWAWIWLCYNSTEIMRMFPSGEQTTYVLEMYLCSTLGIASSMFIAAFAWKRVTVWVDKRLFVIVFGACAAISTILLGFSVVMGAGPFFMLAAVFTGVGTSMLCLKVGRIYGSVSLGDSLTAGAISLLLAALLYFVGIGIPEAWRLFYIAALPFVSSLLLTMGGADPFPSAISGAGEARDRRAPERRMYHKLVMASALVALTAGVGKGVSSTLVGTEMFALEGSIIVFSVGVIAVLIAYVVNRGDAVRGARQVYSALMVLGMAMMLSTCFGFDIAFLSVGKESLWLVFTCFMAYLAFRYDLSPVRVFGIGQGVYFLTSTTGWAVGALIAPFYSDALVRMGVGVGLAFLVVVVLVYVFPENDLKRIMAWSVDEDAVVRGGGCVVNGGVVGVAASMGGVATGSAAGVGGAADGFGARVAGVGATNSGSDSVASELAVDSESDETSVRPGIADTAAAFVGVARAADSRYGLSARELEVLDLFAQGRSANWIADNLTISKNTVRSHLRTIYTKLDVHTRQELLDFLAGKASVSDSQAT